jgi:transcriptional regulator NrdR family protein
MKCDKCGGKLKCHCTKPGDKVIVRRRKCEKCGKWKKTVEE